MNHFTLLSILASFGYQESLLQTSFSQPMMYLGVNIYYPNTELFRHCLYIVEGTSIPAPLLNGPYGCILILPMGCSQEGKLASETVVWPKPVSAGFLLNQIQNLYLSQSSQAHMAHMLMSSLSLNSSIHSIIHQAATIMQNAILLLDPAYQLIAMEGLGCEIKDIFWQDCLEHRRVSDENILLLKNSGLTKNLEQSSATTLWEKQDYFNQIPRLAQKIYSADHIYLGTIAVFQCQHTFTSDDYFLVNALVDTLSSVLTNYDYLPSEKKVDSELLLSFFNSEKKPTHSSTANRRLDEIGKYHFYLAGFIPLQQDPSVSRLGAYLQAVLLSERGCILSALQSRDVVVLLCFNEFKEIPAMEQWLRDKLSPLCITMGLSTVFTELSRFTTQLSLAERAVHLGNTFHKNLGSYILSYPEVAYIQLFSALPKSVIEQYLQSSSLSVLYTKKHTEFYKTLHLFVQHLGSYAETAQALFIHKNTLLYRLSKIQALTGFDYSSPESILSAAFFFAANEYLRGSEE